MLAQLPQMTRTVVRVEKGKAKGKGEDGAGGEGMEEEEGEGGEEENLMEADEGEGEYEEVEGAAALAPVCAALPMSSQEALLAGERDIDGELRAQASSGGERCWDDCDDEGGGGGYDDDDAGGNGGGGRKGRRGLGVSEYRLLGLSKMGAVCDWLAMKLQVRACFGRLSCLCVPCHPSIHPPKP